MGPADMVLGAAERSGELIHGDQHQVGWKQPGLELCQEAQGMQARLE